MCKSLMIFVTRIECTTFGGPKAEKENSGLGEENPMFESFRFAESFWNATKTLGSLALSMTSIFLVLTTALSTDVFAQESVKTFGYYTNANTSGFPDARMTVVNPGSVAGFSPAGDLCANIYVFNPDRTQVECCSCKVSPDGLRIFSVNTDLTSTPASGPAFLPQRGAIKIVSSAVPANGLCSNLVVAPNGTITVPVASTAYTPSGLLGSWITHVNEAGNGTYSVSETNFFPAFLAATELTKLQAQCDNIVINGSGAGICTCGGPPA